MTLASPQGKVDDIASPTMPYQPTTTNEGLTNPHDSKDLISTTKDSHSDVSLFSSHDLHHIFTSTTESPASDDLLDQVLSSPQGSLDFAPSKDDFPNQVYSTPVYATTESSTRGLLNFGTSAHDLLPTTESSLDFEESIGGKWDSNAIHRLLMASCEHSVDYSVDCVEAKW